MAMLINIFCRECVQDVAYIIYYLWNILGWGIGGFVTVSYVRTLCMVIMISSSRRMFTTFLSGIYSVESPSMVDPQWDIWYWGSKWNLHTVCWGAVSCEWDTPSVYFGITYVCIIPSRRPVFAVEPQYRHQYFLFLLKVSFEGHIPNLQNISCWFKIWIGFVEQILI